MGSLSFALSAKGHRMFKRILFGGWALLFLGAFLIVMFPNAVWNHAASWVVWVFSIALLVSTFAFCVLVTIRLTSRFKSRITQPFVGEGQRLATLSDKHRSPRLVPALLVALLIGLFVVGLLAFIEHEIKNSPVYQTSIDKARASSDVVKILGQPIHDGWFCSGELTQSSNGSGHARLTIPISGPNGKGTLKVEASLLDGKWRFSILQFSAAGHAPAIDLCCGVRRN